MTNMNPYLPFASEILEVIKHTEKEYTFRMAFEGEVRPGQFFEVSIPKYGEAPISVSGIGKDDAGRGFVDLTIRKVGRVTNEVFEHYQGQSLLLRGPYGNGFDTTLYENGETVVVAGGTGVSPVRGVIQALSEMPDAEQKYVIAGFRSPGDMLFRDDLKTWENKLNLILTVDGAPEGYTGNIGLVTKYIADLPLKDPEKARLMSSPTIPIFSSTQARAATSIFAAAQLPNAISTSWSSKMTAPYTTPQKSPSWDGSSRNSNSIPATVR